MVRSRGNTTTTNLNLITITNIIIINLITTIDITRTKGGNEDSPSFFGNRGRIDAVAHAADQTATFGHSGGPGHPWPPMATSLFASGPLLRIS